jgi:hypothetical protein
VIRGLPIIPLCAVLLAESSCAGQICGGAAMPPGGWTVSDAVGDSRLLRTDADADGPVNPPIVQGRPGIAPDVIGVRWGGWNISYGGSSSVIDPYKGSFTASHEPALVRIDVMFKGVVNPPGPMGEKGDYQPYLYGNSPVYGFLDIDLDGNRDTGGELGDASLSRYLAVVARFGEFPEVPDLSRVARSGAQLDSRFNTAPQYERSGADFSLVLCGCFTPTIVDTKGDTDGVFGPDDTWIVRGRFFQRAGGFANASSASGGSQPRLYDPLVNLRFSHDCATDVTTVSLVYAVTQQGAARLRCGWCPTQPRNLDVSDDTSIDEGMHDVCEGAMDPYLPVDFPDTFALVSGWAAEDSEAALDPGKWRFQGVFGTAYSVPQPDGRYVWSDVGFDQRLADSNGDGVTNIYDRAALTAFVWNTDGSGFDCDNMPGGRVQVCSFGESFSAFDLNYDGYVDAADAEMVTPVLLGDFNGDCAVNTPDLVFFLGRFGNTSGATVLTGDLNGDGAVNTPDLTRFLGRFGTKCQ